MYRQRKYKFENVIEVKEYHTARYGAPGMERKKKRKPTPEQMERINQRKREQTARHKLRANFKEYDYFSTLTYRREDRPEGMEAAKEHFRQFVRKIRKAYKKAGHELKWMANIECGTKGAWHVHLIINRIPDTDMILASAWLHGKIKNELLYQAGDFKDLAAYITKTPKTDQRLADAHYSASRNLPTPAPEDRTYLHWRTWHKVRIPAGWYLDPESVYEGINEITGYPYRTYTLLRVRRI